MSILALGVVLAFYTGCDFDVTVGVVFKEFAVQEKRDR